MSVVVLGIPQQVHVLLAAVEGKLHQLIVDPLFQRLLALRHGGLYLGALLLQQVVGQHVSRQTTQ
ncbi:hypothetical protein D3C72_2161150 [compost metagenome]